MSSQQDGLTLKVTHMPELLCHLVGDYVLQNHWMATNKVKSSFAAAIHAVTYSLSFLLLTRDWRPLLIICGTHFVIDRWRLARYWVEFWGVGNTGTLWQYCSRDWEEVYLAKLNRWNRHYVPQCLPLPEKKRAPDWLAFWLLILVDNTLHLLINHLALQMS